MAKRALLVGCNYPGTKVELKGCVNDVRRMHTLLTTRFGFDESDILVLVDTDPSGIQPTGANIRSCLAKLIRGTEPGDVLVFHYSGHGTQVPPEAGEAADETGAEEAIVPNDMNLLTDDDFRELVNQIPAGATFTFLSDSCHSGGLIDSEKEQIGDAEGGGLLGIVSQAFQGSSGARDFDYSGGYGGEGRRRYGGGPNYDGEEELGEDEESYGRRREPEYEEGYGGRRREPEYEEGYGGRRREPEYEEGYGGRRREPEYEEGYGGRRREPEYEEGYGGRRREPEYEEGYGGRRRESEYEEGYGGRRRESEYEEGYGGRREPEYEGGYGGRPEYEGGYGGRQGGEEAAYAQQLEGRGYGGGYSRGSGIGSKEISVDMLTQLLSERTGHEVGIGNIRTTLFDMFGDSASPTIKRFANLVFQQLQGGGQDGIVGAVSSLATQFLQSKLDGQDEEQAASYLSPAQGAGEYRPQAERRGRRSTDCGILLSGCQSSETSADATPSGNAADSYGAFSNAVQLVLGQTEGPITNRELVLQVRKVLKSQNFKQHPCLYCSDNNADAIFVCE